ncbi:MAG: hypothetical protein KAI79_00355 [Bacteroidales bacterium]|nr:hypothetical protein [Bacteroidales bacterium]
MKQYIIILLITFFSINTAVAQRQLKYKEVYEILKTKTMEESFMALKEFQYFNPSHANAYYQLGKITQHYSKRFDPMIYPDLVSYFTKETDNYLGLAKYYLEQKGKLSNKDAVYFEGVAIIDGSKKLGFVDVIHDVEKRREANVKYQKNVEIISNYFKKSTFFYDKCIQNFRKILITQSKIKDLYLNTNDSLVNSMEDLKDDFDSTLYYLTEYQNALTNYPIKNYKPEYVLKKIETYRLEGLTNVSFLYNMFYVWNFGKWVKEYKEVMESDIYPLREKMITADEQLNKAVSLVINTKNNVDSIEVYIPADALLNEISKYDFESPIVSLYAYKIAKIDFLKAGKSHLLDPSIERKSYDMVDLSSHFKKVSDLKTKLDKQLDAFNQVSKSAALNKYADFVEKQYKSMNNYKKLADDYFSEDASIMKGFLDNYMQIVLNMQNRKFYDNKYVAFNKDSIALYFNQPDSTTKFVSTDFVKGNKNIIIGGYIIPEKLPNKVGFIAAVKDSVTLWTRSIKPNNDADMKASKVIFGDDNIYAAAQTSDKLFMLNYNITGDVTSLFDKKINQKVQHLFFDDIAEQFLVVAKNDEGGALGDTLYVNTWGKLGEVVWEEPVTINFKGDVVNVLSFGDKFFIVINAKGIFGIVDNKFLFQEKTNSQISILAISKEGKPIKVKDFNLTRDVIAIDAVKINSAVFSIIGQYGKSIKKRNKPLYMLIDSDLFSLKME